MNQNERHSRLLECLDKPAFFVKDGLIIEVNETAKKRMIEPGAEIETMLETGVEEYNTFTGGCLNLLVQIAGLTFEALVTKEDDCDLFVLKTEDRPELQAYTLAAVNLRLPMSKLFTAMERILPYAVEQKDETLLDNLANFRQGMFQLDRIVTNMLFAQQYSANLTPRLKYQNVTSVMEELFERIGRFEMSNGTHLICSNLHMPLYTLIDQELLERGVYNMVSNALKYAPRDSTVQVSLRKKENQLYLTVQNSLNENAELVLQKLFNRYLREPGLEPPLNGIGLGMLIIQAAAKAHGGIVLAQKTLDGDLQQTVTLKIQEFSALEIHSPIGWPDYAGERDHDLLELSELLPREYYRPE